jgi:hypothetical protein
MVQFWFIVAVCWGGLLVAGATWIHWHPIAGPVSPSTPTAACLDLARKRQMPGFIARRTLAPNHWIGQDDLDWSASTRGAQQKDVLSRYSTCAVKAGERLISQETRAHPTVAASSGRVGYPLPLEPDSGVVTAVNAGAVLDVWDGSQLIARGIHVLAVQCKAAAQPPARDCWATVDASLEDMLRFQKAHAAKPIVVVGVAKFDDERSRDALR